MKLFLSIFFLLAVSSINGQLNKDSLFVFVGQRIDAISFKPKSEGFVDIIGYVGTKARYKIIQKIFGIYDKDTIEFETYMYMGAPPFLIHKTVLLFVSEHNGKLVYVNGSFFDLYKATDGRWASLKVVSDNHPTHWKNVELQNIQFADSLWYDMTYYNRKFTPPIFPEPIRNEAKKTIVVKGAYLEDLLKATIRE